MLPLNPPRYHSFSLSLGLGSVTVPYLHAAGKLPPGVFGFAKDQHLFFYNRLFLAALKQSIDGRVAPDNLPLAGSFVIAA